MQHERNISLPEKIIASFIITLVFNKFVQRRLPLFTHIKWFRIRFCMTTNRCCPHISSPPLIARRTASLAYTILFTKRQRKICNRRKEDCLKRSSILYLEKTFVVLFVIKKLYNFSPFIPSMLNCSSLFPDRT